MLADPCHVAGDQAESEAVTERYQHLIRLACNQLIQGTSTPAQWERAMQGAIRMAYMHQAIAGSPTGREDLLSPEDRARVEASIEEQYGYLAKFAAQVAHDVKVGNPLTDIQNRAALYAKSSEAEYWRQATSHLNLPAIPRDGSTECLSNCQCSWHLECGDKGVVKATWKLGKADHCPTCVKRSLQWNPLIIQTGGRN